MGYHSRPDENAENSERIVFLEKVSMVLLTKLFLGDWTTNL